MVEELFLSMGFNVFRHGIGFIPDRHFTTCVSFLTMCNGALRNQLIGYMVLHAANSLVKISFPHIGKGINMDNSLIDL
ncbi:hypothetical protein D7Z94_22375 [Ulvibacterium marinum]|uniref:Uncharacterized protein n=1 Tax=Ulvibacterium marinum TaxID=2419782 RepID=A0A3B0C3Y0_9FLAO|nr:hypothetical protein D7Z94_22375 [Ulvibacterium marinum]